MDIQNLSDQQLKEKIANKDARTMIFDRYKNYWLEALDV